MCSVSLGEEKERDRKVQCMCSVCLKEEEESNRKVLYKLSVFSQLSTHSFLFPVPPSLLKIDKGKEDRKKGSFIMFSHCRCHTFCVKMVIKALLSVDQDARCEPLCWEDTDFLLGDKPTITITGRYLLYQRQYLFQWSNVKIIEQVPLRFGHTLNSILKKTHRKISLPTQF